MRTFAPAAAAPGPDGWTAYEWPRTGAEPHALVALRIPHRFSPGERYMREGWQSWSTPMPGRIGDGVRRIGGRHPPRTARRHWLATPPYVGDESYHLWRSASATAYVEPCNAVFVATPEALLVVREQPVSDYHPRVWFAPRPVPETELADRVALRPHAQPYAGWSSWDVYGPAVRGDDLLDELTAIERGFSDTIEVINVDDGWQRALGDWFPRDRRMAHAIGAVAGRRRLSLWWAPFVVHPEARLAAEHPDWILRGRDGRPIVVLSRTELWEAWALDLSSLDVLGWLGDTARRLAGYGAQLLKCDFLYASAYTADAARRRACADPLVTAEDVHRRALTVIRGAGPAIVASGAPLWPSAGLVDFMRVGPDAGRRWWKPAPPGLEPEFAGGCLANAAAGAQRRLWLHHAAWLNDPDSVYLRACPRWLDWVAAHGLPMVLSEPMRSLNRTERHRWAAAVNRQRTAAADVIPPGPARWDATGSPDR